MTSHCTRHLPQEKIAKNSSAISPRGFCIHGIKVNSHGAVVSSWHNRSLYNLSNSCFLATSLQEILVVLLFPSLLELFLHPSPDLQFGVDTVCLIHAQTRKKNVREVDEKQRIVLFVANTFVDSCVRTDTQKLCICQNSEFLSFSLFWGWSLHTLSNFSKFSLAFASTYELKVVIFNQNGSNVSDKYN